MSKRERLRFYIKFRVNGQTERRTPVKQYAYDLSMSGNKNSNCSFFHNTGKNYITRNL